MPNRSLNELEHCRSVLLRVLNGISTEQLDFQIFPDSKTIGELLMHIAGFEFLIVSGACLLAGNTPDQQLWHKLRSGFAREAGFEPPRGRRLDDYTELLAEIRKRTIRWMGESAKRRMVPKVRFPTGALVILLRDTDGEWPVEQYDKLTAGLCSSFNDDGAENESGEVDLVNLLQLHETYHRGHITLQKYLYARVQQRLPREEIKCS